MSGTNFNRPYTVWIEAEYWNPDNWKYYDSNTGVMVTFDDTEQWEADFYSYQNVNTLSIKNRETQENLSGKYLFGNTMILVDSTSRESVEEVIRALIADNSFQYAFKRIKKLDTASA